MRADLVDSAMQTTTASGAYTLRLVLGLFKLRIGAVIALTALAGWAVTPGPALEPWQVAVLTLAVLLSSASAGAFNQYVERDIDARMQRTRKRAFVTGELPHSPAWIGVILVLLGGSVAAAAWATNPVSALFVFLGAFFYAVVYTVWLKRRTWLNIVVGGLAGSFAVLAGAAAVDPSIGALPLILAVVLFLWTPPHFWSLAMACRADYEAAGVPMLPVVVGEARCAKAIFAHTLALAALSLLPAWLGLGPLYLAGALAGGAWFALTSWRLMRAPGPKAAMANFHASLAQLSLLLLAALADAAMP
jgi:protoheme IX farnesyltransferase